MRVNSRVFGEIDVDDNKIVTFENGLIGFEELKKFALLYDIEKGQRGISWLQSVENGNLALPVMDPLIVKEDYSPYVEDELLKQLGECADEDYLILITVTVPRDITQMTVNLKAPIIINTVSLKASQIITENKDYQVKYPIYDILKNGGKEGK